MTPTASTAGDSTPPTPVRHVTDRERRARLAQRQALAPDHRASTPTDAARAVVALHATELASLYLSCWARMPTVDATDIDGTLYAERGLVRQLSMRQTLFAFPRDLLPAVWGSAAARLAGPHRARMVKDVERHGIAADGEGWVTAACNDVVGRLADGTERSQRRLSDEVPAIAASFPQGAGTSWEGTVRMASRVLMQLSLEVRVTRAHNDGPWTTSRPLWTTTPHWLGDPPAPLDSREGYAEVTRRWLRAFGPGTVEDLQWWLGTTKTAVRTALADVGAVPVSLDGGATGWLVPDDAEPVRDTGTETGGPWAALLPVLDPTVMGWRDRRFYLGPHAPELFDSVGNAGTTAWVDGRVVGAWGQDQHRAVRLHLPEPLARPARQALAAEAARLTAWLDGRRVFAIYPSRAMRSAARG